MPEALLHDSSLLAIPGVEHGFGTRDLAAWPPDSDTARVKQIHSGTVLQVATPGLAGEGDALISSTPGLWVAVKTADCVPILLVDPKRKIVAAVHAGWRGTAAQIARHTIARMTRELQCDPADVVAAIGPAIGPCCFEVGEDVAGQFAAELPEKWTPEGAKTTLDLFELNRRQLLAAGVGEVSVLRICTFCDPVRFHSFRRDRDAAGRLVSAIRLT